MKYFVFVKGILGVKTNMKEFTWSYGTVAPESNKSEFEKCKIKVHVDVRNSKNVFEKDFDITRLGKYHYFGANQNENKIYYERDFFGSSKLRYSIEINENYIHVIVGKNYMKYIKHRIMNLHSISYILTDIVAGLLLKNGIATIHCSAVNTDDQSIIFFAPPNTGKTLTSIQLCKNDNFNFIAEDFALTDGEKVWSVPWTSTFRYYDDINESKLDTLINKLTSYIPVLEFISFGKNKSIDKYLGKERIKHLSKATDLVVLERGKHSVDYNKRDGFRKIVNLNRYEFNYHKSPSTVVINYFNPEFSLEKMYEKEKEIINNLIKRCTYTCIVEDNALNYTDIVLEEVIKNKR